MGKDCPFRDPGGPAGELDQCGVFGTDLNLGDPFIGTPFEEQRKMMPAFFQIHFLWSALVETINIVRNPGDDDPGDLNILAEGPDVGKNHIKGKKCGDPRVPGQGL